MTEELRLKIKEFVLEMEKQPNLSFKNSLMETAISTIVYAKGATKEEFEGKTFDEKLAILKKI